MVLTFKHDKEYLFESEATKFFQFLAELFYDIIHFGRLRRDYPLKFPQVSLKPAMGCKKRKTRGPIRETLNMFVGTLIQPTVSKFSFSSIF